MKLILRKTIFRLLTLLPLLFLSLSLQAQSDPTGESPATRTYAITNATIVQSPGNMMENATIVFKNGLITALGTNVSVPGEAEVIDGSEMFIYPGFIDGMSYTGAERPDGPERPDDLFTPDPPNDYAGITPEHQVVSQVKVDEGGIEDLREIGFTISHTVPYGRMLPGSGALLLLRDAEHPDEMILEEDVSMYTQFVGAPGAYPGNTLGIMAKWRNLYTNATYSKQHAEMYAQNPEGLERPTRNRVLEAYYPVVANDKPVFYNANSSLEAQRAMRLKRELGFTLAIGNLEEGWDLADEIKATNTIVFMSLDLPDEPENSDDEDATDEVKRLEERRMEFYKRHVSQYAALNEAGIKFGFSTMGASSRDIMDNMMTIINNGLSKDAALAALTSDAADLLGISSVTGTLDRGKIGNAVIMNGPIFEEDSKIKFVFVDGDKYEFDISEKAAGGGDISEEGMDALIGSWTYSLESPQGESGGKMILSNEDGELTGILTSDTGQPDVEMENLSFVNNILSFDYSFDAGGQSVEIVVTGTVADGEYDAEVSVAAFNVSFPLTAVKDEAQ